tara:strand:- start:485 stop:2212 length:1728 start_codon:yes stop_codon:yes gene_type:complete
LKDGVAVSLEIYQKQIRDFLVSEDAGVLAIRGSWGSGKTQTFNNILDGLVAESKRTGNNPIARNHYAYVSLFGVSTIKDLKNKMYTSKTKIEEKEKNNRSLNHAAKFARSLKETTLGSIANRLGFSSGDVINEMISKISLFTTAETIVCLDDLERTNIESIDILGIVSELKEQLNCKIILILNEDKIKNYSEYKEKVIDYEIYFNIKPQEATGIVFNGEPHADNIIDLCHHFEITNIRILKKIKKLHFEALEKNIIDQLQPNVLKRFLLILVTGNLCMYSSDPKIPSFDYLKAGDYENLTMSIINKKYGNDDSTTEDIKKLKLNYTRFIKGAGIYRLSPFDSAVLDSIESGFYDQDSIKAISEPLNNQAKRTEASKNLYSILKNLNSTLDSEYIKPIKEAIKFFTENVTDLRQNDLNDLYIVIDYFGMDAEKYQIYKTYKSAHSQKAARFSINDEYFRTQSELHPELKNLLKDYYLILRETPSKIKLLEDLAISDKSMDDELIILIEEIEVGDIEKFLLSVDIDNFRPAVEALLSHRNRDSRLEHISQLTSEYFKRRAESDKKAEYLASTFNIIT